MKSIIVLSIFLFVGTVSHSQNDVCKAPIESPWFKPQPTSGYDYILGKARLENFVKSVSSAKYVYLYYNRNGTWKMAVDCAIPKNYIKTYYFKNGIQYGITTNRQDRPTPITLVKK